MWAKKKICLRVQGRTTRTYKWHWRGHFLRATITSEHLLRAGPCDSFRRYRAHCFQGSESSGDIEWLHVTLRTCPSEVLALQEFLGRGEQRPLPCRPVVCSFTASRNLCSFLSYSVVGPHTGLTTEPSAFEQTPTMCGQVVWDPQPETLALYARNLMRMVVVVMILKPWPNCVVSPGVKEKVFLLCSFCILPLVRVGKNIMF